MYLTLLHVGLLAVVTSNQVFRKLEEFCPYYQEIYINVPASTSVSCAVYCHVQTPGCSRFTFDEVKEECLLYQSNQYLYNETNGTSFRQSFFLSTCEGYAIENDIDSNTTSCIKVYDVSLNWTDARARCQMDGGDLVSITTKQKWDVLTTLMKCTIGPFWIGLRNQTWITGEHFNNVYGLSPTAIRFTSSGKICTRYRLDSEWTIKSVSCNVKKKFVCEILIPK